MRQMNDSARDLKAKAVSFVGTLMLLLANRIEAQTVRREIVVSVPDRKLALVEDGTVKKIYPVAVGKETTPSPSGSFKVVNRVENPTYYHPGTVVAPGATNPLGTRWIGLNQKGYGIHGTNAPKSIGKAASHGCIRMAKHDLEELFSQVRPGDDVEIHAERNQQTVAIFGGELEQSVTLAQGAVVAPDAAGQQKFDSTVGR
jgi:lipoprotein-anchoring transpeptidase ErfK/SrfK